MSDQWLKGFTFAYKGVVYNIWKISFPPSINTFSFFSLPFISLVSIWEVNSYSTHFQTHESIVVLKKKVNLTIFDDYELLIVEPLAHMSVCFWMLMKMNLTSYIYMKMCLNSCMFNFPLRILNVKCWSTRILLVFNSTIIVGSFCDLSKFFAKVWKSSLYQ